MALIEQTSIVAILSITVAFFLILLLLGVRKSYKLKAENDRLSNIKELEESDEDKEYKDFTESHLYDNENN